MRKIVSLFIYTQDDNNDNIDRPPASTSKQSLLIAIPPHKKKQQNKIADIYYTHAAQQKYTHNVPKLFKIESKIGS